MGIAEHRRLQPGAFLKNPRRAKIVNPRMDPALIAPIEPVLEPAAGGAGAVPAAD
jgi:hypothetical protein